MAAVRRWVAAKGGGGRIALVAAAAVAIVAAPARPAGLPLGPVAVADEATDVDLGAYHNGALPGAVLEPVAGVWLARDAARAFAAMQEAAARDGVVIAVTDGYRTYEEQVDLRRRKGALAAPPGTSMHGWGRAVDLDLRVTDVDWMRVHAARFGWIHPAWAQPGGSKPEPWHWEFVGIAEGAWATAGDLDVPRWEVGDLVATARLERAGRPPGAWFEIREGTDDLEQGARHYTGTAGPGAAGNFAVAGYQYRFGGPLRGVALLVVGDGIRVHTPDGDELVYEVVGRARLTQDDGWAVGPDPAGDGTTHLMTLTTASSSGRLLVVWAHRQATGTWQ